MSPTFSVGSVALLVRLNADADPLEAARANSLLRATVEFLEVVPLDLEASDIRIHRRLSERIKDAARECHAQIVIVSWDGSDAPVDWADLSNLHLIVAPSRLKTAKPFRDSPWVRAAKQIWIRNELEAQMLARVVDEARIKLVPDHFEGAGIARIAKEPELIALLASETIEDSTLLALCDEARSLAQKLASRAVLVVAALFDRIAALQPSSDLGGLLLRVGSLKELEARASHILVHGEDAEVEFHVRSALRNDCDVHRVGGKSTKPDAPHTPMTHAAVAGAVGRALTIGTRHDRATIGQRLSRALSVSVTPDFVHLIAPVRLLHAEIEVSGMFPPEALGGVLIPDSDTTELVNAWVQVCEVSGKKCRLRATAAIPQATHPSPISLSIELWGIEVARLALAPYVRELTSGLISVTQETAGQVGVDYWGEPDRVSVQCGTRVVVSKAVCAPSEGPMTYRATAAYPFDRNSITIMTPNARGRIQKFSALPAYLRPYRPSSVRFASMKDMHAGRIGWLVGNGPSVRIEDLDALAETNAVKFCFNRFYLAHDATQLKADYTVTADDQMITDFGEEIISRSGGTVFVASASPPKLTGDYCWTRQVGVYPSLFSRDASRLVTPGGSSLYVAMQIGYYMGIRRWFVYGADFSFEFKRNNQSADVWRSAVGDSNHFIEGYRSGKAWCPPSIENILPSFFGARQLFEAEGGWIRNATRGGKLETFDLTTFEEALATR